MKTQWFAHQHTRMNEERPACGRPSGEPFVSRLPSILEGRGSDVDIYCRCIPTLALSPEGLAQSDNEGVETPAFSCKCNGRKDVVGTPKTLVQMTNYL